MPRVITTTTTTTTVKVQSTEVTPRAHERVKRQATEKIYVEILALAKQQGFVTHKQACDIGGWNHGVYHLRQLAKRGELRYAKYNRWDYTPKRWQCSSCGLIPVSYNDCECLT